MQVKHIFVGILVAALGGCITGPVLIKDNNVSASASASGSVVVTPPAAAPTAEPAPVEVLVTMVADQWDSLGFLNRVRILKFAITTNRDVVLLAQVFPRIGNMPPEKAMFKNSRLEINGLEVARIPEPTSGPLDFKSTPFSLERGTHNAALVVEGILPSSVADNEAIHDTWTGFIANQNSLSMKDGGGTILLPQKVANLVKTCYHDNCASSRPPL